VRKSDFIESFNPRWKWRISARNTDYEIKKLHIKDIWETLHIEGAITFSYEAFRNHVNAWQNPSKPPTKENRKAQTNKDDDKKKIPPKPNLKNRLSYQVLNTIQYPTKRNSTNVKNTHHFAR
jgi:hypothetical protein